MFALHLLGEIQAHILHRHAKLLLLVDREAQLLHLTRIVRIGLEVEQARSFAVIQKSLAVDLAGIARNREMYVLSSGLREIDALERRRRPSRFMPRHSIMTVLHE